MKLILLLLLCFLIIFIAYKIFIYYKSRQYFFDNLCEFCNYTKSQIGFLKNDICTIVNDNSNCYKKDFKFLLNNFVKIKKLNCNFKEEFYKSLDKLAILKTDEKDKLLLFFDMLGKTDINSQIIQINAFKDEFENKKKVVLNDLNKSGIMTIKLGLILSLAIFIIFI